MRVTRPTSTYLISTLAAGLFAAGCGGQERLYEGTQGLSTGSAAATGSVPALPPGQSAVPSPSGTVPGQQPTSIPGNPSSTVAGPGPTNGNPPVTPASGTPSTPVVAPTNSSGVVTPVPSTGATDTPVPSSTAPVTGAPGPGYYTSKDWHGCAWTGTDTNGGTTLTPADFTAQAAGEPFCIKGSVAPKDDYSGVSLLGFNLNEDAAASCVHKTVDPAAPAQPSVTKTADGIAINFVKQGADTSFTLRVQIQGPNGHKDGDAGASDRWCANITETTGKFFVPWGAFDQQCWFVDIVDGKPVSNNTEEYPTVTPYKGEPLSAVVFTVPGDDTDAIPYDYCVNGWAYGASAADAPDGSAVAGDQMGTLVDSSAAGDSPRAKVSVAGENYIVQPNAWGTGASVTMTYKNNSFAVTSAGGSGDQAPASFPSMYVGANGFTNSGQYSTKTSDNLPVAISAIKSANTTFRWTAGSGVYNATYDVWFANADPAGKRYNDGLNGFVMVWLHNPGSKQPIGSSQGTTDVAGKTWTVWKGNRGSGPSGDGADLQADPNAPVVSFVATSDINSLTFNLKDFIDKAVSGYGFPASLLLTDVFAGFEIWSGGNGLKLDEFKIDVQK